MPSLAARALLAAFALAVAAGPAAAGGAVTLELRSAKRIPLAGEATNVVVADPSVADVMMTDAHSLMLLGRGYGVTEVMVTGRGGKVLFDSQVSVTAPDAGRVTLTRGTASQEYACAGRRCHFVGASGGGGGAGGAGTAPEFTGGMSSR